MAVLSLITKNHGSYNEKNRKNILWLRLLVFIVIMLCPLAVLAGEKDGFDKPKAIAILVRGKGKGSYAGLIESLKAVQVKAFELKEKDSAKSWDSYLAQSAETVRADNPLVPLILIAEDFGALNSLNFLRANKERISYVIFSNPILANGFSLTEGEKSLINSRLQEFRSSELSPPRVGPPLKSVLFLIDFGSRFVNTRASVEGFESFKIEDRMTESIRSRDPYALEDIQPSNLTAKLIQDWINKRI